MREWSNYEIYNLKKMINSNICTECIAKKLNRSVDSIRNKASELKITLNPKDKNNCSDCAV